MVHPRLVNRWSGADCPFCNLRVLYSSGRESPAPVSQCAETPSDSAVIMSFTGGHGLRLNQFGSFEFVRGTSVSGILKQSLAKLDHPHVIQGPRYKRALFTPFHSYSNFPFLCEILVRAGVVRYSDPDAGNRLDVCGDTGRYSRRKLGELCDLRLQYGE